MVLTAGPAVLVLTAGPAVLVLTAGPAVVVLWPAAGWLTKVTATNIVLFVYDRKS